MITILTPTYNRGNIINNAYESLVKQTNKNFEWLVIDDGSTDDTKSIIHNFSKQKKISVRYLKKENGGKHSALNLGIKKAKGNLILILDSDDYLREDAIELVYKYWDKYKNNKKLCGMTFLRKINNPIYKDKLFDECVSNMIDFKYNEGNLADMCEVMRKDILLEYPYPIFEGEKFLSEVIVTGEIAKKYDTAYIPIEIYYTNYLEDGLSLNWLNLVVKNPLGARANCMLFMDRRFKFKIRLKNCILFNIYSFIGKKKIFADTKMKVFAFIFFIPSWLVSIFLKIKYARVGGK